ncbi:unnamed protein product [Kluyveromyces dobzhanskii CBS 2104]|uniref:WGS project CCBQ000000000 data, contig 00006 n=1 Tax=Kluyveromyces dobzhanskii CBS 2104 TaxID=1427455 RepID=A0A0A8L8I3_9SACH|nr:unnamed protein product [Kluyveromyces dobzhanskii CBS 2104]
MQLSTSCIFLVLITLFRAVSASSSNFTLKCYSPGTDLAGANIYVTDDNKIYIANSTLTASGVVIANGSLQMEDGKMMGIGKNFLSLQADSASFEIAYPFIIENGVLKLYDEDFHAVPSGKDGVYVLGSVNAAAGRDDVIPIQIKAIGNDGNAVSDYKGSSVTSTSSYSVLGSQTFDESSASAAALSTATSTTLAKSSSKNIAPSMRFNENNVFAALLIAMIF